MKILKKIFGGIDLTWTKLIIFAVAAGVYTAVCAIIPALHYTSFHSIVATFEVWIFFGIFIIMNSRSNKDSALKCFVFFLISQPLVYLLQVPFSWQGWELFRYYPLWFVWTVLCLPMGYIGYYIKKGKWWGYLILLPMILLTALEYSTYLSDMLFYFPKYLLIVIFCAAVMFVYPLALLDGKKIRIISAAVSAVLVIVLTVTVLLTPHIYTPEIMASNSEHTFDGTYRAYLADEKYGGVEIRYDENFQEYVIKAEFRRGGNTTLVIEAPDGTKTEYDLRIEKDTYDVTKK